MDAALFIVMIVAGIAVAAVVGRIVWESRNGLSRTTREESPGGWFGGE